jgi:DNA primase
MVNYDLLALLERVLGKGRKTSGNNYAFFSPFVDHYKPKLEIDLTTNNKGTNPWHCWVSNVKGRDIKGLFKKLKKINKQDYETLYKIIGTRKLYVKDDNEQAEQVLVLPTEYIKLSDYSKVKDRLLKKELAHAITYLKNRGLSKIDLLRYDIGYCSSGKYSGRVVVPSFDENYELNYFVTRTIFDDDIYKHKNPKVSKDIIGFESFINWNQPITLVEGAFDAITARFNAIPLFGKILPNVLKEKIILRRPPKVIIALDSDARVNASQIANYLLHEGINVSIVNLDKKDVNEMGFDNFLNAKLESNSMDSYDIIKYKVLYG